MLGFGDDPDFLRSTEILKGHPVLDTLPTSSELLKSQSVARVHVRRNAISFYIELSGHISIPKTRRY